MNFRFNFKETNRRVNNKQIKTFFDLQFIASELFPHCTNYQDLTYCYIDSDNDEVTMLNDEDVKIMNEDMGQNG